MKYVIDPMTDFKGNLDLKKLKFRKPLLDPKDTRVAPEGKHGKNQENALKDTMYTTISELDTTL